MSALPSDLIAVFPEFGAVPTTSIQYWLNRSVLTSTWGEDHATILYACHLMAVNGLGAGLTSELAADGLTGVSKVTIGPMTVELAKSSEGEGLESTRYGRQFKPLLNANKGALTASSNGASLSSIYDTPLVPYGYF